MQFAVKGSMPIPLRRLRLLIYSCACCVVIQAVPAWLFAAGSKVVSLNGDWNFATDPSGSLKLTDLPSLPDPRKISIPGSWQSQFQDLRDYAGVAWYWRSVTLDALAENEVALLRFAAVDYKADVYINDRKAGSHEGGYLPFEFDVTGLVHPGENQVFLRVVDPGANPSEVEGIKYAEIPHGKQNWYVQTSGPWQEVELAIKPRTHLGTVHIRAGHDGNFTIQAPVVSIGTGNSAAGLARLHAEIEDPAGKKVWEGAVDLKAGEETYEFSGHVANPSLWNLERPALYTLRVSLAPDDTQESAFGFRTFEARGGKFFLNGKLIYLRGALDQAFYPQTMYTEPSLEDLRAQMRLAKALGLNMLRCHIKVPSPRYLQAADREGLLVWYEIPNWDKLTENSKRRGAETLRGMIARDWNHPSIVMVSVINESWGANLKEAADRQWLKQAYHEAKQMVPGWLVDDNSACCENFHVATDVADFHTYNAIPDYAGDFDRFVADQARRPGWLFSPYGDAERKGDEPMVLSEFGNWGLPKLPAEKPWWLARKFENREITAPEGWEKRFREHQYAALFDHPDALLESTERREYAALKYEIESLRMHPEIQGYVITEFTDINWECNGLLSMWRKPKTEPELFRRLQQDDLMILRVDERNHLAGTRAEADVYFSHYSSNTIEGATAAWELEGGPEKGSFQIPASRTGSVVKVGTIQFTAPSTVSPVQRTLKVSVMSGGKPVSEDSVEFFFYPKKAPELPPPVSFDDPRGKLRRLVNEMHARNYQAPLGTVSFPVVIASSFDERVKQSLRNGGRVILIANDRQTLAPGLEVLPRAGSDLDGNWISSFLWVRKDRDPFKQFPFPVLPGFETHAVTPSAVLRGIPPEHWNDVLSGIFYGWIHENVATLVQARYGRGRLLICTFSVATTYGNDPYATALVDALVRYAASDFAPGFEIAGISQ